MGFIRPRCHWRGIGSGRKKALGCNISLKIILFKLKPNIVIRINPIRLSSESLIYTLQGPFSLDNESLPAFKAQCCKFLELGSVCKFCIFAVFRKKKVQTAVRRYLKSSWNNINLFLILPTGDGLDFPKISLGRDFELEIIVREGKKNLLNWILNSHGNCKKAEQTFEIKGRKSLDYRLFW
jgi:hypothetical protein